MSLDKRVAEREILRHAHHRAVHGAVSVRMIAAEHVTDRRRRLAEGLVVRKMILIHSPEYTPLTGLHAVADVGQRA